MPAAITLDALDLAALLCSRVCHAIRESAARGRYRHGGRRAQFVLVVEVLVAERDPEHPLADKGAARK